jgi:hypothetical protein
MLSFTTEVAEIKYKIKAWIEVDGIFSLNPETSVPFQVIGVIDCAHPMFPMAPSATSQVKPAQCCCCCCCGDCSGHFESTLHIDRTAYMPSTLQINLFLSQR